MVRKNISRYKRIELVLLVSTFLFFSLYFVSALLSIDMTSPNLKVQWTFSEDHSEIYRDGELLAKSKWDVQTERTFINFNSWFRKSLKRSLIDTKLNLNYLGEDLTAVTRSTPFYKYWTRGSYAGYLDEEYLFKETDNPEEFPEKYLVSWEPRDTRNYRLVWKLYDVSDLELEEGIYSDCNYQFGNLKIDLKENCKNLDYAEVIGDTINFHFKNSRGDQNFDLDMVDPPTKYEFYDTGASTQSGMYANLWKAQTFTVGDVGANESFDITHVRILAYKSGSPGTVTVGLRATSGGNPTGSDLVSGSVAGTSFCTSTLGCFKQIDFDSTYALQPGVKYAIVLSNPDGDFSNSIQVRYDHAGATYSGGDFYTSSSSGSSWSLQGGADHLFEIWGNKIEDINVNSPQNISYNTKTILINITNTTEIDTIWFFNGTGNETYTGEVNRTYEEGGHTFLAYSNTSSGDNTTITVVFTVSLTSPLVNIVYPTNTTYNFVQTELNYTASDDNLDSCWYSLDGGGTNTTITCGTNVTGLDSGQGSSTWTIYANTTFGKENSTEVTFFVDSIPPAINFVAPTLASGTAVNDGFVPINVTATDTNFVNVTINLYDSSNSLISSTNSSTSPLFVNITIYFDGLHYFNATACDGLNCNYTETRNITVNIPRGVTSCRTLKQAGTFTLQNDLTSTGTCMTIEGDDIIFDGNGYDLVFGTNGGTNNGILLTGPLDNVTIKNTNITAGSTMTAGNESSGITYTGTLQNSLIYNNTIYVYNGGIDGLIASSTSINNNYSSNTINSVGRNSMEMGSMTNDTISNNVFLSSGNEIDFADSTNVYIVDNTFDTGSTYSVLFSNSAIDNIFERNIDFKGINDLGIGQVNVTYIDQTITNFFVSPSTPNFENTSFGRIDFLTNINGSFGGMFPGVIRIENNSIFMDTSILGENKSALIKIYNLQTTFVNPAIYNNGTICDSTTSPSCYNLTGLNAGNVIFNVSSGGNYSISVIIPPPTPPPDIGSTVGSTGSSDIKSFIEDLIDEIVDVFVGDGNETNTNEEGVDELKSQRNYVLIMALVVFLLSIGAVYLFIRIVTS